MSVLLSDTGTTVECGRKGNEHRTRLTGPEEEMRYRTDCAEGCERSSVPDHLWTGASAWGPQTCSSHLTAPTSLCTLSHHVWEVFPWWGPVGPFILSFSCSETHPPLPLKCSSLDPSKGILQMPCSLYFKSDYFNYFPPIWWKYLSSSFPGPIRTLFYIVLTFSNCFSLFSKGSFYLHDLMGS